MLSLLVFAANRRVRAALACAAGFALGIGQYLCWSRLHYGGFLETFLNGWSNLGGPTESFFYYLKNSGAMLSWLTIAGLAAWVIRRTWDSWGAGKQRDRAIAAEQLLGEHRRWWEGFLWLWALAVMLFFSNFEPQGAAVRHSRCTPAHVAGGCRSGYTAGKQENWPTDCGRHCPRQCHGLYLLAGASPLRHWIHRSFGEGRDDRVGISKTQPAAAECSTWLWACRSQIEKRVKDTFATSRWLKTLAPGAAMQTRRGSRKRPTTLCNKR